MSRVKTKLNTCATLNALSLKNNVRNMLRRNMAVMEMHSTGEDLDAEQRKKLKKETESMARHFTCILGILISFMTDEEVRQHSFMKITNPNLLDSVERPIPGGLYDPALGPLDERSP